MNQIVGIAEMKLTQSREDVLVTYSLGSCVGLSVYDPVAGVGGLVHCMLPLSKIDPAKAQKNPAMFVDTGVSVLLQSVMQLGASRRQLVVKVAGGSLMLDDKKLFNIGERNFTVVRKLLWKNNILINGEDVGGAISRTMFLYMNDGRTVIRSQGHEREL